EDYVKDEKDRHIYLSEEGVAKAERFFNIENLGNADNADLNLKINSALRANFLMTRDKEYIVENDEVIIIDEFTGRKMAGRRFSEGLHQAIEAKENVRIKKESKTIATITFQNLFRMYNKLSGMTGTAMTEEAEFKGIYNLDVVEIPTHEEMIRVDEPDKIYLNLERKYAAVIDEIVSTYEKGQPILVGTIDVDVSEHISKLLKRKKIPHNVLNAKRHKEEADIIAQAGRLKAVTIATNMAGRGTDILLGGNPEYMARKQMAKEGYDEDLINIATAYNVLEDEEEIKARERFNELKAEYKKSTDKEKEEVKKLGGLRVIGTERHESRRIDNQLRGRSGRQGDEGSSCFYLSFEDELLRRFGGDRLKSMMSSLMSQEGAVIQMPIISRQIETAQKRCEDANFERRKYVMNYDDVMNKQRQLIYSQRNEVLRGADVHDQVMKYLPDVVREIVYEYADFSSGDETSIEYEAFNRALEQRVLKQGTNIITQELCGHLSYERIINTVVEEAVKQYEEKIQYAEENGINFKATERNVLLNQVDRHWMDHIDAMDTLRKGIGLRGYGHKDPILEYRREGFEMFENMIESIQKSVVIMLCKLDVHQVVERRNAYIAHQNALKTRVTVRNDKSAQVGRNSPCPCGSGKKYKICCGR
ncbi:MAG: SEC-C metal-binding domain-containing protein, partial [Christensenellales bacterium]